MTLPNGWALTTLGECQGRASVLDPRSYQSEIFDLYSVPSYSDGTPEVIEGARIGSTKQEVLPDDVLLCKIVPHIRRGWVIPTTRGRRQIASGEWIVLRDHGLEPRYLQRFVLSDAFHAQFMQTVSGVGGSLMRARPAEAGKIAVPVPPLAEQRRIIAKLDVLTARLARARVELERASRLHSQLRRSVFDAAVSGTLVPPLESPALWSDDEQRSISVRRKQYLSDRRGSRLRSGLESDLKLLQGRRKNWLDCRLADVISLRVGHAFRSENFSKEGVPLLRGANVAPEGVDWTDTVYLAEKAAEGFSGYVLAEGHIVLAMDRPLISSGLKIARISRSDQGCLLVQRVANPLPSEWVLNDYVGIVLRSSLFIKQIEEHATGTDLPHISSNDILTTPCPLPPLQEQRRTVQAVQAHLSVVDRVEAEVTRARALIDRLEASILAKAFRGELVPQNPADEHASVLLERIRAERAATPMPRRKRLSKAQVELRT